MGTKIFDILPKQEIDFASLNSKTLAIDGNLQLYQFLSSIRQRDGSLLTDSSGNVTSHVTGLFSRATNLLQKNMKLIYVFDGTAPDLKKNEWAKRRKAKQEAQKKYAAAADVQDFDLMKKYASRTSHLTKDMIEESKQLLTALGIPVVQALSEGEAQAAQIVKDGNAFALATQDADAFTFGAPNVIKNLSVSPRKKQIGSFSYKKVNLELFNLVDILNHLGIDQDQLIAISMLVGTDYNNGGIKGLGSKKSFKLVKTHGNDLDSLFQEVKWSQTFDFPWTDLFYLIKKMPVSTDYSLKFSDIDVDKVKEILCEKHDFSSERIDKALKKLIKNPTLKNQKGLSEWF